MRILILNQAFHPDVVSTAQHASDLAVELAARGHDIHVIASRRAYDNPSAVFSRRERWKDVVIARVSCSGFGKKSRWRRAVDFATYFVNCSLALLRAGRYDAVVVLTSPPLISVLAAAFVILRGGALVYWAMDLNPDEAVAAGWLAERSWITRALQRAQLFSLRRAERVVVLDRFMKDRILRKGIPEDKLAVIAPWSHDRTVRYDPRGRDEFRRAHGLERKFVVMYSGNHSPCHPLDTLLEAAAALSRKPEVAFCFVGGGSEFEKVRRFAQEQNLENVVCLPYQPLDRLSASLSAADLHVVVLGDPFVGIVHPCKIYNILALGSPVLYIGPWSSHITDLLPPDALGLWAYVAAHGNTAGVVAQIGAAMQRGVRAAANDHATAWSQDTLLPKLCAAIESAAGRRHGADVVVGVTASRKAASAD